jgi:hypothetical protein
MTSIVELKKERERFELVIKVSVLVFGIGWI